MIVRRRPIRSRSDPADPRPWADLTLDAVTDTVRIRNNNGQSRQYPDRDIPLRPSAQQARAAFVATGEWVEWCLWQDLDGSIHFTETAAMPPIVWAHLGIYQPWTDELELLSFVEL